MFALVGHIVGDKNETIDSEGILKDLVDKVSKIDAEVHALDAEYQKDLLDHEKVCLHSPPEHCYPSFIVP